MTPTWSLPPAFREEVELTFKAAVALVVLAAGFIAAVSAATWLVLTFPLESLITIILWLSRGRRLSPQR